MMIMLAITSLVGLTFILERAWVLRWNRVIPEVILEALDTWKSASTPLEKVLEACHKRRASSLGRLLLFAAEHRKDWSREESADGLEARARQEVVRLERGLVVLEIVVGIAPLMGLIGTIQGLMLLFAGIGDLGQADGVILARGIAVALNTTLAGLLIAIPSLVAWSYFNKKVEAMAVEMEGVCGDFLRRLYRRPLG